MSVRNRYKPRVVAPFRNQPGNSTSLRQGSDGSCSAAAPLYRRYISCGLSHYRGFTNGCTQFLLGNFMPIFCCYSGVQDVVTYLSGVSGFNRHPIRAPRPVPNVCRPVLRKRTPLLRGRGKPSYSHMQESFLYCSEVQNCGQHETCSICGIGGIERFQFIV